MNEPIKCYAVSSGDYSEYQVHAIYRRREDAEARVRASNETKSHLIDGVPADWGEVEEAQDAAGLAWGRIVTRDNYVEYATRMERLRAWRKEHLRSNPHHEDGLRVEEFDYYEGEPLLAAQEMR